MTVATAAVWCVIVLTGPIESNNKMCFHDKSTCEVVADNYQFAQCEKKTR